jgi:hypothetical protein
MSGMPPSAEFSLNRMAEGITQLVEDGLGAGASTALYDLAPTTATVGGAALPTQACAWVIVTADPGNTETMFVGSTTNQRTPLVAGQAIILPVTNANLIEVRSAGGTAVAQALAGN